MPKEKRYAFEIVEIDTDKVVQTVPTRGKSESQRERVERGLLRNMDCDRFFIREVEVK